MAEQDYSRWAAFGGGPPAKKKEEPAAVPGFNPTFSDAPSQPMGNSMDYGPIQGAQQEKSFAPGMSSALMKQASNRYDGGMQNFRAPAPQYDEGPPMESSYQNMRHQSPPMEQAPPPQEQGFWDKLNSYRSRTMQEQPQSQYRQQTGMNEGYGQSDRIGQNWGQPAPQRQMDQSRRQPPMQAPRQAQGFRQQRPMPQRRPQPQYGRGQQNSGGNW